MSYSFPVKLNLNKNLLLLNQNFSTIWSICNLNKRWHWRKWLNWPNNWLPFHWEKPEPVPGYFKSGDRKENIDPINLKQLKPSFVDVKALKDAPEDVKKLFTFEFARHCELVDYQKSKLEDEFKTRFNDYYSLERRIARYTITIRVLTHLIRNYHQNDAVGKIKLNKAIMKRNGWLNELYKRDRSSYENIIKRLEIDFEPALPGVKYKEKIERKREIRRLSNEYCKNMIDKKLEDFHEKLKEEQKEFEKNKKETEEWIKEQMIRYNIDEKSLQN